MRTLRELLFQPVWGLILALSLPGAAAAQNLSAPNWTFPQVLSGAASNAGQVTVLTSGRELHRLDAGGRTVWKAAVGDIGRAFPLLRPDGSVLAAAYDDSLYAFGSAGQQLWKTRLDGDIFASPALLTDSSAVVVTAGGSLYRLGTGGEVLWRQRLGSPSFSSPAVSASGQIVVGSQSGAVFAFGSDGTQRWRFQAGRSVFSSPALDDAGNVYFGSADGQLYSLTPAGELRWKRPVGGFVNASPIVTAAGQVVVGGFGGQLHAFGLDGTPAWTYQVGAAITAPATELWNGDLLVGDLSGVLHRVSGTGAGIGMQDLGERIDTPVTVADDGTWLVTADGNLRAYASPWPQAAGPWSSFRGVPQGWGRALSAAEQEPWLAARRGLAGPQELALAPAVPAPVPSTDPALSTPAGPVATQPTPTPPTLTQTAPSQPVTSAPVAAASLRLVDRRVHLPLADLAGRFGVTVAGTGSGQASLNAADQTWTVPVAQVDSVPYISIVELGRALGARVTPAAEQLTVEWQGQTQTWPLDWITLYANPVQSAPASVTVPTPSDPAQTP